MTYCDVLGYLMPDYSVRECPHPAVIKKHGLNGKCNVSYYVCKKCAFGRKAKLDGGLFCDYGKGDAGT